MKFNTNIINKTGLVRDTEILVDGKRLSGVKKIHIHPLDHPDGVVVATIDVIIGKMDLTIGKLNKREVL